MSAVCQFVPGARSEYDQAARYYTLEVSPMMALRLITSVESGLRSIAAAPELWRVVEPPDIRRYVVRRFPFVLYYSYEPAENLVIIYALMHTSRQPGYWRARLPHL